MQVQGAGRRWQSISRRRLLAGAVTGATLLVIPREVLSATGSTGATGSAAANAQARADSLAVVEPSSAPSASPAGPAIATTATYQVVTEQITYRHQGGTVYRPVTTAPHPVIYFLHGGFWQAGGRAQYDQQAREWAELGWVAVTLDYSLAVDYRVMLRDIWAGVAVIERQPYADPDRQIISGDSAGGHLAALVAVRHPSHFRGQMLWSPVISPENAYIDGRGSRDVRTAHLRTASKRVAGRDWAGADPSLQADALTPPLFLAASRSEFVPYQRQGELLVDALGSARAQVHLEPGKRHGAKLQRGSLLREAWEWAREQVEN